jgi:hypothetical protein
LFDHQQKRRAQQHGGGHDVFVIAAAILRHKCGMTSPTQPITPLTGSLAAVTDVAQTITAIAARLRLRPMCGLLRRPWSEC